VGEKYPKRLECLEFIPLQGSDLEGPSTLIIFRFEIDDKGNEGKPVDGDLLKWSRLSSRVKHLNGHSARAHTHEGTLHSDRRPGRLQEGRSG